MSEVFYATRETTPSEPFEVGTVQWLRQPGDNGNANLASGIWTIHPDDAPDPFDLPIEQDETIYIIDGHIRIEVQDGQTHELTAGSMASLSRGAMTRWTILAPTTEFFVYS